MGRYIIIENGIVVAERYGSSPVNGEIESTIGQLGQILQPDGTFADPPPVVVEPTPTIEERLTNIEDTQDLILLKLDGVIA